MEAAVESVLEHPSSDNVKINEAIEKTPPVLEKTCTNGIAESTNVVLPLAGEDNAALHTEKTETVTNDCSTFSEAMSEKTSNLSNAEDLVTLSSLHKKQTIEEVNAATLTTCEVTEQEENVNKIGEGVTSTAEDNKVSDVIQMDEVVVESENIDTESTENVRFETEILIESNDVNEVEINDTKIEDPTNNILSELGQNIELSDVLRSSDVTESEHADNNNCAVRQEVFNKEELLDILEGNDVQSTSLDYQVSQRVEMESQKALEQLSRLKQESKRGKHSNSTPRKKFLPVPKPKTTPSKEENIVKALVQDWDDEEDESTKMNESSESTPNKTANKEIKEETPQTNRTSIDSATSDGQTPSQNKASDEGQQQGRLGRVIRKKVIFDPDNPDTYTKSKMNKNKESPNDKEPQPSKKVKLDQSSQRAKSKSPISKMQWKKPPPKNSKQIKRLSEVDKLLMDEGAVNMIYQLTPEAPKGKKNMKTKAEFIKKLQSSTPEGKEMKFRERKCIKEEVEAKKITGGKQRSSLSSSVKSPSACDDFETHSADDSIIYRRHSSSSYSSSCMSPRRLSDVDANVGPTNITQPPKTQANLSTGDISLPQDVIPQESSIPKEIINKDDCLSLKKKLNSKLAQALSKRKRETTKTDNKSVKRKLIKNDNGDQKEGVEVEVFKHLSVTFCKGVAKISIRKTGSPYHADIFYELEEALARIDGRSDISLTLLTSECGTLCSEFDLSPLLDFDVAKRTKTAQHIAESVRCVLSAVSRHSKVVVAGVWGACRGVGLALAALSDVALAADGASFALAADPRAASLLPGVVAVLAAQPLPQALVNDLVIFERQLSASEALQKGLISRVLWPTGVSDQLQTIVSDIAQQPIQTLLLKKKLLNLRRSSDNTFLAQLEAERALFVEHWSSSEGMETLLALNSRPIVGL